MKMIITFLVVFSSSLVFAKCELTKEHLINFSKMTYYEFDQTMQGGFRALADKGCNLEAGLALDFYYAQNFNNLLDWQKRVILFHAGQVYAYANLSDIAINRFNKTYNPNEKPNLPELNWNDYVKATIAFLNKDMKTIKESFEILNSNSTEGNQINANVILGFINCLNKTYAETFSPICR